MIGAFFMSTDHLVLAVMCMVSAPIIILAIGVFGIAGRATRIERRERRSGDDD